MKDLKKKLTAAAAMLVVSAVMLSGVSYAWYTLSTNPEVKGITATAVANQNLEIALVKDYTEASTAVDTRSRQSDTSTQGSATNNYYTWGNVVDVSQMLTDNGVELRPATYEATPSTTVAGSADRKVTNGAQGLYYPTYGDDGRISGFDALKDGVYTSNKEGVADVYAGNDEANGTKYAFRVDYWLKTNVAGKISLTDATLNDKTNGIQQGGGSYISTTQYQTDANKIDMYPKDAIKVVFKVQKNGETAWTWKEATCSDISNGKVTLSGDVIDSAEANTGYKVSMYVYLNGNVVTNAMAETAINDIKVNVQFNNNAITDTKPAMQK